MGGMPDWFAKTAEMCASDLYFSIADAGSEANLIDRYKGALAGLQGAGAASYHTRSKALDSAAASGALKFDPNRVARSLGGHFRGDWINHLYDPANPTTGRLGGRYWPSIPSTKVLDVIKIGTQIAILKAIGRPELAAIGLPAATIDELYRTEDDMRIECDSVRPLATSWNCVAPPGDLYFQAAALRGPSIVELAIATPRPMVPSGVWELLERVMDGVVSLHAPDLPDLPQD